MFKTVTNQANRCHISWSQKHLAWTPVCVGILFMRMVAKFFKNGTSNSRSCICVYNVVHPLLSKISEKLQT